jgi:DNA polymerase I-like protein with 3'-5' exonuclease and polymerase domains
MVWAWRRLYPEFGVAYKKADQMAAQKGYVRVLPNTRYELRSFFGPRDFSNTAWNRVVQGSLAEAFGMWLAEIEKQWPGYMILTVHDSVVLEAPLDEGDEVAQEIAKWGADFMTDLFNTPMGVDVDRW